MAFHTNNTNLRSHKSKKASNVTKVDNRIVHIAPEPKWLDYSSVTGAIGQNPAGWSSYYVPALTQGTGPYSRIGNQVWSRRLELHGGVARNTSGSAVQLVRLLVVRTISPANASLNASELFSATNLFDPLRNLNYVDDFRILYDRLIILDSAKANFVPFNFKLNLGFETKFSANSGTATDCTLNAVNIVAWSDQSANPPLLVNGVYRFNFTDQ